MQVEASGDVGTLFFLLERMGIHGWRDMNQDDLSENGMRQGVFDSDLFIFFLTNSVLSRPFCLKELSWALEFGKPIVVLAETEDRFFPFDLGRWQRDEVKKDTSVWPHRWVVDSELGLQYDEAEKKGEMVAGVKQAYPHIVEFIERTVRERNILPFRRREFEVDALVREIIRRAASNPGIKWGSVLPPSQASHEARLNALRRVCVITSETERTTAIATKLKESIKEVAPYVKWCDGSNPSALDASTSHCIVLLSEGVIDDDKPSTETLSRYISDDHPRIQSDDIVYLYLDPTGSEGWDFGAFYGLPKTEINQSIAVHEALKWRGTEQETTSYEHLALVFEMLKRLRAKGATAATTGSRYSLTSADEARAILADEARAILSSSFPMSSV